MPELIDLEGLSLFKTNMDAEIDAKIAAAIGSGGNGGLYKHHILFGTYGAEGQNHITFIDNQPDQYTLETFLSMCQNLLSDDAIFIPLLAGWGDTALSTTQAFNYWLSLRINEEDPNNPYIRILGYPTWISSPEIGETIYQDFSLETLGTDFSDTVSAIASGGAAEVEPIISINMTNIECKANDPDDSQIRDIQFYCTKERWDNYVALAKETYGIDVTYENFGTVFANSSLAGQNQTIGYLLMDHAEGKLLPTPYMKNKATDHSNTIAFIENFSTQEYQSVWGVVGGFWEDITGNAFFPSMDRLEVKYSTADTVITVEEVNGPVITGQGGGSGKLYEYSMNLEAYDYEGNIVTWNFDNLGFSTNPKIVIDIYESNFEKLKEVFLSMAQQMGVTITLDSPQDLATLFNTYFNETGEGDFTATSLLMIAAMLADKITINSSEAALPVGMQMFPWTGISHGFSIVRAQGIRSFGLVGIKQSEGGSEDYAYGLNANNTCRLIEYGTSSSGGSEPQESPLCYVQFTDQDTGYIFFTFDRTRLNNAENVTAINEGIQNLNNIFSLEIPAYTKINDMQDISEYIHNLSEDYAQAKVVFWAQFLTVATRMSISMKAYKQSVATAPIITAIADVDEGYTYTIKYFDISGQLTEWWDSNTHHNFRLYVDTMD